MIILFVGNVLLLRQSEKNGSPLGRMSEVKITGYAARCWRRQSAWLGFVCWTGKERMWDRMARGGRISWWKGAWAGWL